MGSNDLDFSQYQPDWRGDVHESDNDEGGIFLDDELIESLKPLDAIMEGEQFVTGEMFLRGVDNLATAKGHNGPFTVDEVMTAVNEVVQQEVNEACDGLVAKGLAEYDADGNITFKEPDEFKDFPADYP